MNASQIIRPVETHLETRLQMVYSFDFLHKYTLNVSCITIGSVRPFIIKTCVQVAVGQRDTRNYRRCLYHL